MICFDTGPLIWGVQGRAREHQQELVGRTKKYIRHLAQQKTRIMVPAPVAGEYLVKFSDEERPAQGRLLEKSFFVPSLDLPAAELAAELEGNVEVFKQIRETWEIDKPRLHTDAQIIAIAIVHKAAKLISHDSHMQRLAQGRIPVEEVPVIHEQMDLLDLSADPKYAADQVLLKRVRELADQPEVIAANDELWEFISYSRIKDILPTPALYAVFEARRQRDLSREG